MLNIDEKMIFVYCLLLATVAVQRNVATSSLTTLKASVTAAIDIEARKELLFLIVGRINDTVQAQTQLISDCEKKINKTVDACNACQDDMCKPSKTLPKAFLNIIETGLNFPIVYAGQGVESIGKWFAGSSTWMGNRAGEFSKAIGSTANTIGKSLKHSLSHIVSTLGSGFNAFGNEFVSSGNKLIDAAKKSVGGILGLGNDISNLANILEGAVNNLKNGFNSFMSNIGSSISNAAPLSPTLQLVYGTVHLENFSERDPRIIFSTDVVLAVAQCVMS